MGNPSLRLSEVLYLFLTCVYIPMLLVKYLPLAVVETDNLFAYLVLSNQVLNIKKKSKDEFFNYLITCEGTSVQTLKT